MIGLDWFMAAIGVAWASVFIVMICYVLENKDDPGLLDDVLRWVDGH